MADKKFIDLNCDMGESYGRWILGADAEIMPSITSANVACGFHGGDPHVMRKTVELALKHRVAVGSHPSLPDLMGFGRRVMDVSPGELKDYICYQTGALREFLRAAGTELQHMKPHGILYSMLDKSEALATAVGEASKESGKELILMALATGPYDRVCRKMGVRVASEGFADRAYNVDLTLVSRKLPGSLITDPKRARRPGGEDGDGRQGDDHRRGGDRHLRADDLLPRRHSRRGTDRADRPRGAGEGGLPGEATPRVAAAGVSEARRSRDRRAP